jgi:carbamoyl-phosphate synthase large subunit
MAVNVLMTGAGAPGAAGILKCLALDSALHVIAADANPNAIGRYIAKDFVTIPVASDENFIASILSVCKQKNIHVLMPLVTKELLSLASNVEAFTRIGVKVMVSSAASIEIANNKSRLYEFLQWRGIAVPDFRVVEHVAQFETAAKELGFPEKQICFKPSVSNGSRGFRIVSSQIDEQDLLFNHKPGSAFVSLYDAIRILSARNFPELLLSEYLPGDEYSVDCLARRGKSILIVPRLRKKILNGISAEGEFINNPEIIDYCKKIIHDLDLHGNIGIQVKASLQGRFLIIEINPRVQGTICAALGAGINLPLLAIKQEMNQHFTNEDLEVKWGIKFARHSTEIFF